MTSYYLDLDLDNTQLKKYELTNSDMSLKTLRKKLIKGKYEYLHIKSRYTSFDTISNIPGIKIICIDREVGRYHEDKDKFIKYIHSMPDLEFVNVDSTNIREIMLCPKLKSISAHICFDLIISPTLTNLEELLCFDGLGCDINTEYIKLKYLEIHWYTVNIELKDRKYLEKLICVSSSFSYKHEDYLEYLEDRKDEEYSESDFGYDKFAGMTSLRYLSGDILLDTMKHEILNGLRTLILFPLTNIDDHNVYLDENGNKTIKFSNLSKHLINLEYLEYDNAWWNSFDYPEIVITIPEELIKLKRIKVSSFFGGKITFNLPRPNILIINKVKIPFGLVMSLEKIIKQYTKTN